MGLKKISVSAALFLLLILGLIQGILSAPMLGAPEGNFLYEQPNGPGGVAADFPGYSLDEGEVVIYCDHTDSKGRLWSTY